MLSEELRKRLSQLNRKSMNVWAADQMPVPLDTESKEPERADPVFPPTEVLTGEEVSMPYGTFLRIVKQYSASQHDAQHFLERFRFLFEKGGFTVVEDALHADLQKMISYNPEDVLYLDIETCGLSSVPLFLIGTMSYKNNDFHIEQLFARDYTEEHPLLAYLLAQLEQHRVLVTYNGKAFDYPFIKERGMYHRLLFPDEIFHFDLLHEARRRWRELLPDCKLQTLEKHLLKRWRTDDIPGHEIPEAYHEYVRTGDTYRILTILKHNVLDVMSMAELVLYMLDGRDALRE